MTAPVFLAQEDPSQAAGIMLLVFLSYVLKRLMHFFINLAISQILKHLSMN